MISKMEKAHINNDTDKSLYRCRYNRDKENVIRQKEKKKLKNRNKNKRRKHG